MSLVPSRMLERPLDLRELAQALLDPVKQMLNPHYFEANGTPGYPAWERADLERFVVGKLAGARAAPESPHWRN